MNESLLRSLLRLFFVVVEPEQKGLSKEAIAVIAKFLEKDFSRDEISEYLSEIEAAVKIDLTGDSDDSEELVHTSISQICNQINSEFEQHQKVWLALQLIEFIGDTGYTTPKSIELIQLISSEFNISLEEFNNGKDFILSQNPESLPSTSNILSICDSRSESESNHKYIYHRTKGSVIYILRIASTNTLLVKFFGNNEFFLNSRLIKHGRAYIFGAGSVMRSQNTEPLYYSNVISVFFHSSKRIKVRLSAIDISYRYKGSTDGLHPFSFEAESGQFIGIIGGSGVGKSTLLNLLNGNLKPASGKILINGFDILYDKPKLKGTIGYVPQDDLLIEDLSVYQNLFFSAKFCFGNYDNTKIVDVVNETIKDFDLFEARNLKVGSPLKKYGGF